MVSLYGVPLFSEMSFTSLLCRVSASFPMPPLVENTSGVKELFFDLDNPVVGTVVNTKYCCREIKNVFSVLLHIRYKCCIL